MKYLILLLILFLFSETSIVGQNISQEFGKISNEEIRLKYYDKDSTAEAVVLFDIGKSYFVDNSYSFDVIFEKTTRIKIFSEAGLKWAEVEIPFYQEGGIYEKVYDIEAYTYNLENGVFNKTMLNISNCFDEKVNKYWNVKKFVLPNVKEGSIIEYRYKIDSEYKFNLRDWEFQWRIPVIYSEYEVKMIPFYEYSFLLQGADKFDSQKSYIDRGRTRQFGTTSFQDMIHKYTLKNIPAFKDEEFITSINDFIIKLDFQLAKVIQQDGSKVNIISTWSDLIDELNKDNEFGKYINKSKKLASKFLNLDSLENKSSTEKFDIVLNYVKKNYNWDNSNAKYASKSPSDFTKDKYGNSADINLFVVGLLNACGIEAFPVLTSTRNNGKIKYDYPYSHFFNYVLISANIDGNKILSDATEILSSNYRIPSRCINYKGLLVSEENPEWIDLQCKISSEIETNISIDFNNFDLIANIETSATEYSAYYYRTAFGENQKKIKEELTENNYNVIDSSIIVKNQLNINNPYILEYSIKNKAEIINEKIFIIPFLNETISENPLKQNTRSYSIDMTYPKKNTFNSSINIPEGYKVDFIPKDYTISNNLFELVYKVKISDKKVDVSFSYFFRNSIYSFKDYSIIKFYFNEIVKKGKEKIVLIKI